MASRDLVFNRQSLRLPNYDYRWPGAYFLTICAYRHRTLLTDKRIDRIVRDTWAAVPEHFKDVYTDAFVVMPNHVHGILVILENGVSKVPDRHVVGAQHAAPLQRSGAVRGRKVGPRSLSAIVRSFKSAVSRRVNEIGGLSPLWQRNYYERVLRNEKELEKTREYISLNPVKWKLDRANPSRAVDAAYDGEWAWLEGELHA